MLKHLGVIAYSDLLMGLKDESREWITRCILRECGQCDFDRPLVKLSRVLLIEFGSCAGQVGEDADTFVGRVAEASHNYVGDVYLDFRG